MCEDFILDITRQEKIWEGVVSSGLQSGQGGFIRIQLLSYGNAIWIQVYFLQHAVPTRRRHACTTSEFTNRIVMIFLNEFPYLFCILCPHWRVNCLPFATQQCVLKSFDYAFDRCVMNALRVTKPFTKFFAHYVARIGSKIKLSNETHLLHREVHIALLLYAHTYTIIIHYFSSARAVDKKLFLIQYCLPVDFECPFFYFPHILAF